MTTKVMSKREVKVAEIQRAIREDRAYLDTAWGRRKVVGYDDSSGWAVTNNTGDLFDRHSFMVTLDSIVII